MNNDHNAASDAFWRGFGRGAIAGTAVSSAFLVLALVVRWLS